MKELMRVLPVVALRGATILPDMIVHFDISRDKSVKAVEAAMLRDQEVCLITQRDIDIEDPKFIDLYSIGVIAKIKQVVKLPNHVLRILVEGNERAELLNLVREQDYLEAEVGCFENTDIPYASTNEKDAMLRSMKEIFTNYCQENHNISKELITQLVDIDEVAKLVDQIAINLPFLYDQKQRVLEAVVVAERYELLGILMSNEIEVSRIRNELQRKVKEQIDKNQKEYILREQLKLIREELGDDMTFSDAERFLEEAKKLPAADEVKVKIKEEVRRFKNVGSNSPESAVVRGYIETLLSLPWNTESKDNKDIKVAREVLASDHYGLLQVKERILEFLAVRSLTKQGDSPILCLIGPPGTGKTSIAKSIAKALNKQYVRMSLGGVRDEAEIRGHRRTYVGAMPGRIVAGLKQAGVKNPLMLLDEIDKVSSDHKGDTSAALLEVLDSEQNDKFVDHYVELPIDLSEVLFIATANDPQLIPRPLLDRMELIEITSYTENEKIHIANDYLIPKQMLGHGIKKSQLKIKSAAVAGIISAYTKEAGVRGLERKIGEICRKAARMILEDNRKSITVSDRNLKDFLGREKYSFIKKNEHDEIGIVRGLAWTSVGGDTLQIEVNILPGKGDFVLTGQLGDVMKESAQAGISYIRSIAKDYDIAPAVFKENDIHIHIPDGAVPKDGPSAGITMATAMLSALINKAVKADLAMTGEITLRGRVLPIGGLKEKLLAAKAASIKSVLVPAKNQAEVAEIEQEIKEGLEITFVETMADVLTKVFVSDK